MAKTITNTQLPIFPGIGKGCQYYIHPYKQDRFRSASTTYTTSTLVLQVCYFGQPQSLILSLTNSHTLRFQIGTVTKAMAGVM